MSCVVDLDATNSSISWYCGKCGAFHENKTPTWKRTGPKHRLIKCSCGFEDYLRIFVRSYEE